MKTLQPDAHKRTNEYVSHCASLLELYHVWEAKASCKKQTPLAYAATQKEQHEFASKFCSDCPVKLDCLYYSLVLGEENGVWGGLVEKERRSLFDNLNIIPGKLDKVWSEDLAVTLYDISCTLIEDQSKLKSIKVSN